VKECFSCRRCFGDHNENCDFDQSPLKTTLEGLPFIADRYRLDERIGTGALGACYLGFDIQSRCQVAVKVILSEYVQAEPNCVPIFFQEVESASGIDHPNVVRILDYGKSPSGYLYVVMEFLHGPSLKTVLKRQGAQSLEQAVNITCLICYAVNAAHIRGQFHRDLKPSNIVLVDAAPDTVETIKVLDFGLSRIKSPQMLSVLPPNKYQPSILGTPYYVPPEQCEREEFDERSEIYSIGIILYHMLIGEVPFKGHSYPNVIEQHINKPPRSPRELRADLSASIETVVLRAIEKDPDRRFQSVLVLANLLRQALKNPTPLRRTTWGGEGKKTEVGIGEERIYASDVVKKKEDRRDEGGIQSMVSDLLASIEPPPPRPTRRLKAKRRTQSFEAIKPSQSAEPPEIAPSEDAPPVAEQTSALPDQQAQNMSSSSAQPAPAKVSSHTEPPVISDNVPGEVLASPPNATRRKLPPPPPHEDRPEHYTKRLKVEGGKQTGTSKGPTLIRAEPARAEPASPPKSFSNPESGSAQVCLIEPIDQSIEPVSEKKGMGATGRSFSLKAEARPVALSPAAVIYLFSDQFLPPKKLRQYGREMHNFFVVERESIAALLLVVAIISLRRRSSLKLSPVSSIVPLLRRKLELEDDDKFVLQLVNGAIKPLDVLERYVLESLGKLNAASLHTVYGSFQGAAGHSGQVIAAAELLNDSMADELVEFNLIERHQKSGNRSLDPGESDHSYKANEEEIERYSLQLDDVKQLIGSVKDEPPLSTGTSKVLLFDYLFDYYRGLFRRNSLELAQV
jgi:eukaryotic-like serine/threonine-protein kinase